MTGSRNTVPLIDGIALRPFLELLDGFGAPSEKLLTQAHLPRHADTVARQFVSARSLLQFLSISARETDIESLGWRTATESEITCLGAWGEPVSRRRTLRDAIGAFCDLYPREITFVRLGLSFERGSAWLWRERRLASRDPAGERHGEEFTLGSMVKVVRQFAGAGWMPSAIRLDSGSPEGLLRTGACRDVELSLNQPAMAIAVPLDLLDRPLPPERSAKERFAGDQTNPIVTDDFLGSMHAALASIVSVETLSIELGAEMAGTSPRTLRRWLHQEGTSWRRVVDGVRLERAVELFQNSPLSVADISFELGYSDSAHFTRAFRRWTGECPRAYRRRRLPH